jgi:hypothetical protein
MSGRQSKFNLRELGPEAYALWDRFVYSVEYGTLFHTTAWGTLLGKLTGRPFRIIAVLEGDTLIGGLLFWPKKILGLKAITLMPATTYQGVLVLPPQSKRVSGRIARGQEVVTLICERLKTEFDFIQMNLTPGITDVRPYVWAGFQAEPVYTYSFPIRPMEEMEFQFNRTLRQNIRSAKKEGLYTETSGQIQPLLDYVQHSYRAHGKRPPLAPPQLKLLFNGVIGDQLGSIYYLKKEETILAGFLALHDSQTVYALFMGIEPSERNQNYNKYIYASVMERKELIGKRFDFLGANEAELETLKRSFGGELQPFFRVSYFKNKWIRRLVHLRQKQHLRQRTLSGNH